MTKISSGLKLLFLVHFGVGLVFGLLYLFNPAMVLGLAGMTAPAHLGYSIFDLEARHHMM